MKLYHISFGASCRLFSPANLACIQPPSWLTVFFLVQFVFPSDAIWTSMCVIQYPFNLIVGTLYRIHSQAEFCVVARWTSSLSAQCSHPPTAPSCNQLLSSTLATPCPCHALYTQNIGLNEFPFCKNETK